MLVYHPAFDVYHGIFRFIKLLNCCHDKTSEKEKLKLIDFYLLFPELISTIRLKRDHLKYKKTFAGLSNKYNIASVDGQAKQVFDRMEPFHNLIFSYLEKKNYIRIDYGTCVHFLDSETPKEILEICMIRDEEKEIIYFLSEVLSSYVIKGENGLKDRTKLMEYRYDYV
ncbi:MAG: ABC-three component system middle component 5 [Sedimentisphaerales bacterium]